MSYQGPKIRATKSPLQYPYQQYPYQDWGKQLTWRGGPPPQTRAADAASLGSLAGPTLELPRPGTPEFIPADSGYAGIGDCGCGCKGAGTCRAVGGVADTIAGLSTPMKVAAAVGIYFITAKLLKKRRR
jgi:hypothetical protein